ncbi:hypothetical protein AGMMS49992_14470 [Clostridia bacterium]|nr:hypothetical protein AGMMS49992_14470 [Clostridia bacterium]
MNLTEMLDIYYHLNLPTMPPAFTNTCTCPPQPGLEGNRGCAGPMGATGPKGVKGDFDIGPIGDTGPTGPMGPQGPQGPAGWPGPTGIVTGPAGPAGPKGPRGPAGPRGPQGVQGPQGLPGGSGNPGPAGEQGLPGDQGARGPRGDRGGVGPPGYAEPGPTGPNGDCNDAECEALFDKLWEAVYHSFRYAQDIQRGLFNEGLLGPGNDIPWTWPWELGGFPCPDYTYSTGRPLPIVQSPNINPDPLLYPNCYWFGPVNHGP